jgi:hypothetical protein
LLHCCFYICHDAEFGIILISPLPIPCFKENRVLEQPNPQQPVLKPHRATLGFAFSIVGGILILIRGLLRIVAGDVITFVGSDEVRHRFLAGLALNIVGGVAVAFAIIILVGAYLIYNGMEIAGGTLVLIFSVLSIMVGSGWLIGLIFGVVGGILALLKK